jgi:hypothetical protein
MGDVSVAGDSVSPSVAESLGDSFAAQSAHPGKIEPEQWEPDARTLAANQLADNAALRTGFELLLFLPDEV